MSELSVNLNAASTPAAKADSSVVLEEQRLMVRLSRGEEAAMEEVLQRHGSMLARFVGRLTAWHSDREDILQDVFLIIWQKAGSFRGDGPLEGWLRRIAVNRCRNHFRATNSIKRLIERFAATIAPNQIVRSDNRVYYDSDESESELRSAMQRLSSTDRTALVLFYLEDMPGDEVAGALGVKPETLHVRLHRARKKLKALIEETKNA